LKELNLKLTSMRSFLRAQPITVIPCFTKFLQIAAPHPELAPVTRATLFSHLAISDNAIVVNTATKKLIVSINYLTALNSEPGDGNILESNNS